MKVVPTGTSVPIEQYEREIRIRSILEVSAPLLNEQGVPEATARLAAEMLADEFSRPENHSTCTAIAAARVLARCGSDEMRTAVFLVYTGSDRTYFFEMGQQHPVKKPKFSFLGRRR